MGLCVVGGGVCLCVFRLCVVCICVCECVCVVLCVRCVYMCVGKNSANYLNALFMELNLNFLCQKSH